jgi:DNA-binding response OmpR family regulator
MPRDETPEVLLISDAIPTVQAVCEALLDQAVIQVSRSGRDALGVGIRRRPRLVIIDAQLMSQHTLALLAWLRSLAALAHTPVLILGAEPQADRHEAARDLQAVSWLAWPEGADRLASQVAAILRRHPSRTAPLAGLVPSVSGRVLVVDDDVQVLAATDRCLSAAGAEVFVARSARGALEVLAHETVDTIVLDIGLPDTDGLTLAAQLLARPGLVDVPVLMLTGLDEPEIEQQALDLGAFDFIAKPFNDRRLCSRVVNAMRRRQRLARAEQQARAHAALAGGRLRRDWFAPATPAPAASHRPGWNDPRTLAPARL